MSQIAKLVLVVVLSLVLLVVCFFSRKHVVAALRFLWAWMIYNKQKFTMWRANRKADKQLEKELLDTPFQVKDSDILGPVVDSRISHV